jgi:hypothetical protein
MMPDSRKHANHNHGAWRTSLNGAGFGRVTEVDAVFASDAAMRHDGRRDPAAQE